MSGSEFERENIVMDALSAAPVSKPDEPLGEEGLRDHSGRPPAEGLYDPALEKDSCGVGFIANIKGRKSHQIISDAIDILCNLEHRGAVGADPRAGDGPGILVQSPPDSFLPPAAHVRDEARWFLCVADVRTDNASLGEPVKPPELAHIRECVEWNRVEHD